MVTRPEDIPDVGFDAILVDDDDRVIAAGSRPAMRAACVLMHGRYRGDRVLTAARWLDALPRTMRQSWDAFNAMHRAACDEDAHAALGSVERG